MPGRPLLVVSNRLPYDRLRDASGRPPRRNVGGLVNALEPVLVARGGSWIGWDGTQVASAAVADEALASLTPFSAPGGTPMIGLPLSEREVARYYHGFANRTIWPLFHGFPTRANFAAEGFRIFDRVNDRFARAVLRHAGEDDRVWVHDYHLMLVPGKLRELGFRGRIDVFLHIPFPALEIFRVLPWRREILSGLLGADTLAFHLASYRDNAAAAFAALSGSACQPAADGDGWVVTGGGRTTRLLEAPIGVDVDDFRRVASSPDTIARARRLREVHGLSRIVFSADRLDYTKGILERLAAVERYLEDHPEAERRVTFVQVVVPSRHQVDEYRALRREVDREVGRINGEHGREGWVPVHHLYRALDRSELVAYYLAADAALVTPLRDGMNLVASEFVASRLDGEGVLVLSEFAGVSERLDAAVLVNPYDVEGTARAIAKALAMEKTEQRLRMQSLRDRVSAMPVSRWAERCLGVAAGEPTRRPRANVPASPLRIVRDR